MPHWLHRWHTWTYRGQVIPSTQRVAVEAAITHSDDASRTIRASGFLPVDGNPSNELTDFRIRRSTRARDWQWSIGFKPV